jgi:hypothetical protein
MAAMSPIFPLNNGVSALFIRCYNLKISAYLKAGLEEQQRLEPIIDMLRLALETFDFAKLRTRYPALAGGTHHNIRLSRKNKLVTIAIDNTTMDPLDDL